MEIPRGRNGWEKHWVYRQWKKKEATVNVLIGVRQSEKAASSIFKQEEGPVLEPSLRAPEKDPRGHPGKFPNVKRKELITRAQPWLVSRLKILDKNAEVLSLRPLYIYIQLPCKIVLLGQRCSICMANPRGLYSTYSGVHAPSYIWLHPIYGPDQLPVDRITKRRRSCSWENGWSWSFATGPKDPADVSIFDHPCCWCQASLPPPLPFLHSKSVRRCVWHHFVSSKLCATINHYRWKFL